MNDRDKRLDRLRFRAWHRGTREADYLCGGFFDRFHQHWDEAGIAWFEAVLERDDVDVLAWAFGTAEPPAELAGPLMERLRQLDYIDTSR